MSKEKEYFEISPVVLIIAILVIGGLIAFFVLRGDSEDTGEIRSAVEGVSDSVFDDPGIVSANVQLDLDNSVYVGVKEEAKYAVVEFSDFQCPFCARHSNETLPSLLTNYVSGGDVLYFFNDVVMYPPESEMLSLAGLCVYEGSDIDTYMEFRKLAYDLNVQGDESIFNAVSDFDIDSDAFKSCYDDKKYLDWLDRNDEIADSIPVQGVPAFVVGELSDDGVVDGFLIPGAYPFETFDEILSSLKE